MNDKILVVIDVQNDFVTGSLGSPAAVAVIDNICAKIENFDGQVVATQDTHYDNYLDTDEGKKLPIVHCLYNTWGHDIEGSVFAAIKRKYCPAFVKKSTFGSINLISTTHWILDRESVEIILIGLVTDICVITNALVLKTFYPKATITVDASCCAGTTPENHAAALQVMRSCQVNVVNDGETFDIG